jgi:hypothetical protein
MIPDHAGCLKVSDRLCSPLRVRRIRFDGPPPYECNTRRPRLNGQGRAFSSWPLYRFRWKVGRIRYKLSGPAWNGHGHASPKIVRGPFRRVVRER